MFISSEHVIFTAPFYKEGSQKAGCLFGCRFCFVWRLCFRLCLVVARGMYNITDKMTCAHMLSIYSSHVLEVVLGNLLKFRKFSQPSGMQLEL